MSITAASVTRSKKRQVRTALSWRNDPTRLLGERTSEEFHAFLESATEKYEYIHGKVVKMPGASFSHNLIAGDIYFALESELTAAGSSCLTLGGDQKVYISRHTIYLPDITVVCGQADVDSNHCLRNPTLIVEVLSPSTAAIDQGDKFRDYRSLPSLQHYVLVDQDRPGVTHYARLTNGYWGIMGDYLSLSDTLSLTLSDATLTIPLSRIYRRVTFPASVSTNGATPTPD